MLKDIERMATHFKGRFANILEWPELHFTDVDKDHLSSALRGFQIRKIGKNSFELFIDNRNSCIIPSQYLAYAVIIKEFALNLREYTEYLEILKTQDTGLASKIRSNQVDLDSQATQLDPYSKKVFLGPFQTKSKRVDAKDIINADGSSGDYKFRATSDFFGSVILKVINVPDSSTSILGKIIYELSGNRSEYSYFEDRILPLMPFIVKEKSRGRFVEQVLRHLESRKRIKVLYDLLEQNSEDFPTFSIGKTPNRLTSIFRVSSALLDENELISGDKPRFFPEPFLLSDNFLYLSTEWTNNTESRLDIQTFKTVIEALYSDLNIHEVDDYFTLVHRARSGNKVVLPNASMTQISKPFLLLAGISGTGKTRFVTQQAKNSALHFGLSEDDNYCLVPVRPDWHEPTDLLGYISRINGTKYIATDFLKFMVKALVAAVDSVQDEEIVWKDLSGVAPYWLCLDEMNLAPVEQYFADYLSILETREWKEGVYSSKPMMQPGVLHQLDKDEALDSLWGELFEGIADENKADLCNAFKQSGIPLPPNLIVAGTVNMDETTHGFSRKVIDRALTIDFQEFFKNDYNTFFGDQIEPKLFTFPFRAQASVSDLPEIDADGEKSRSVEFLKMVNQILINTPFELAYRALNELLLAVTCFTPYEGDEAELRLYAVWDDFLMQKVLPRIEGDSQKLRFVDEQGDVSRESDELKGKENIYGKGSVLHQLYALLETDQFADIWGDEEQQTKRPDLLRVTPVNIECRSKKKLLWMMKRLKANHFTDFWV